MWETAGMVRWNENEEREDGGGDSERRLLVRARTTGAGRGGGGRGLGRFGGGGLQEKGGEAGAELSGMGAELPGLGHPARAIPPGGPRFIFWQCPSWVGPVPCGGLRVRI